MRMKLSENGQNQPTPLTPRQEAAALALAAGLSIGTAAKRANVARGTVKSWLRGRPGFKRKVRELRAELTSRALGVLTQGMVAAAVELKRLCLKGKSETTRLRAADALLSHGAQLQVLAELQARVDALEGRS